MKIKFPVLIARFLALLDTAGSGYAHSHVGKWNLSTVDSGGASGPLLHGFDWSAGGP